MSSLHKGRAVMSDRVTNQVSNECRRSVEEWHVFSCVHGPGNGEVPCTLPTLDAPPSNPCAFERNDHAIRSEHGWKRDGRELPELVREMAARITELERDLTHCAEQAGEESCAGYMRERNALRQQVTELERITPSEPVNPLRPEEETPEGRIAATLRDYARLLEKNRALNRRAQAAEGELQRLKARGTTGPWSSPERQKEAVERDRSMVAIEKAATREAARVRK